MTQLPLPLDVPEARWAHIPYRERLRRLLLSDLDFHGEVTHQGVHAWHAFPAKFPPQLPRRFIVELTSPGECVLDPMMGSGTTVIEAISLGRHAVGMDIDPLSLRLVKAKCSPVQSFQVEEIGHQLVRQAEWALHHREASLVEALATSFDEETRAFIDYWFLPITQKELMALMTQIRSLEDKNLRDFFFLIFSSVIVSKTGGVSLALDLAHTRPHRYVDKRPSSAFEVFLKRLYKVLKHKPAPYQGRVWICEADSQRLPLPEDSIDLIVTSPPYASHAIDYMRAHKFSLVWMGYSIQALRKLRQAYIGGDASGKTKDFPMPEKVEGILHKIDALDAKKGRALRRYFLEMGWVLKEMFRVLKPGKAAILVVGSSVMRGVDTRTHIHLGEIAVAQGFYLVDIGVRVLDRDKRMMPTRWKGKRSSIEHRMHEEFVIGLMKPETCIDRSA
ncbi:MAG: hypothetical protein D6819_10895 [Gammaproteobacteria bacterium]|nr:MAG: hypothetical protein D6819_10895 [Gammaproteobacteria bacterium]